MMGAFFRRFGSASNISTSAAICSSSIKTDGSRSWSASQKHDPKRKVLQRCPFDRLAGKMDAHGAACLAELADCLPEGVDGPDGPGAQMGFEYCEGHLDR